MLGYLSPTRPSKAMNTTDTTHCVHVMNRGASNWEEEEKEEEEEEEEKEEEEEEEEGVGGGGCNYISI